MSEALNKCVWMWAGLLTFRLCDRQYKCGACPVEQLFHPSPADRADSEATVATRTTSWFSAKDRFFDAQHLWLRVLPAGRVQIGLDAMAANLLLPAESVELPRPGTRLQRGREAVRIQLGGTPVPFDSPVTGEVIRIHQIRAGRMRSALRAPYTRAWLFLMSVPRLEQQLSRLLFGRDAGLRLARDWSGFQQACLETVFPAGVAALPDGGELDLERLQRWAGPAYPDLVGRWIGARRATPGKLQDLPHESGFKNPGGLMGLPEAR